MKYFLKISDPDRPYIHISIETETEGEKLQFHLPKWRPGRYEIAQYERNIADLKATDELGQQVELRRTGTHSWELSPDNPGKVYLTYNYYANQWDAGGSFIDREQILVNGINLFLYQANKLDSECQLSLDLPESFHLGGGLDKEIVNTFDSFHDLVDSPFVAARNLIHHPFDVNGLMVHLWFSGDSAPDLAKIENDIRLYSLEQISLFGSCPVSDYHYLYCMVPFSLRHGVEHKNSTAIVMGPSYDLMTTYFYKSFLELSSHEFFHTWNVKALRPKDMLPYAYNQENYSRLHYITEGITTYYGDLMLWKSGIWDLNQWIDSINGELDRFHNFGGKDFVSLSESSMNSWVNGYHNKGYPNRRISFYTKGYLVAMLMDFKLRADTQHQVSLDTIIRHLYLNFREQGYDREDFKGLLERFSNQSWDHFFAAYIDGTEDLTPMLQELASFYGLNLELKAAGTVAEMFWGISLDLRQGKTYVKSVLPNSEGEKVGLLTGDQIIAFEGREVDTNLENILLTNRNKAACELHYFRKKTLRSATLRIEGLTIRRKPQLSVVIEQEAEQQENVEKWRQVEKEAIR